MQQSSDRKYTYLQEIYSREHKDFVKLDKKYKRLYLTDIDRLWLERGNNMIPLAMIDLKWNNELYEHNSKLFDHALITGFVKFCFYIICYVENNNIIRYKLIDYMTRENIVMKPEQYAQFLLEFRDNEYCNEYRKKQKSKYSDIPVEDIKTAYPNAYDIFFNNNTDNNNAARMEDESLHDYLTRKNIVCSCSECMVKHKKYVQ